MFLLIRIRCRGCHLPSHTRPHLLHALTRTVTSISCSTSSLVAASSCCWQNAGRQQPAMITRTAKTSFFMARRLCAWSKWPSRRLIGPRQANSRPPYEFARMCGDRVGLSTVSFRDIIAIYSCSRDEWRRLHSRSGSSLGAGEVRISEAVANEQLSRFQTDRVIEHRTGVDAGVKLAAHHRGRYLTAIRGVDPHRTLDRRTRTATVWYRHRSISREGHAISSRGRVYPSVAAKEETEVPSRWAAIALPDKRGCRPETGHRKRSRSPLRGLPGRRLHACSARSPHWNTATAAARPTPAILPHAPALRVQTAGSRASPPGRTPCSA